MVSGLSTDLLREAARRAGVTVEWELLPWRRAYALAQSDATTCVYSTSRTAAREPLFKWVGPLINNEMVLFATPDSSITLGHLEDARPYTIGVYRGTAVEAILVERGFKVDSVQNDGANAVRLDSGRIDLWAANGEKGPRLARAAGLPPPKPLLTFESVPFGLACNPAVDDHLIAALSRALETMWADGAADAIKLSNRDGDATPPPR